MRRSSNEGHRNVRCAVALLLLWGTAACSDHSLTREKAKTLIEGSPDLAPTTAIAFQVDGFQRGVRHGRWSDNGLGPRAPEGVAGVDRSAMTMRTATPRIVVEVTGIADVPIAPGMKEAKFVWAYRSLPEPISWYAARGGQGSAALRLYDDGWRLEGIEITQQREPWPLSAAEQERIVAYEKELEQARMAAEARRRDEEAEQRRIVAESKRSTRTIATFDGVKRWACDQAPSVAVQVTDATIEIPLPAGCQFYKDVVSIPYHDISSIGIGAGGPGQLDPAEIRFKLGDRYGHESLDLEFATKTARDTFLTAAVGQLRAWRSKYPFGER